MCVEGGGGGDDKGVYATVSISTSVLKSAPTDHVFVYFF